MPTNSFLTALSERVIVADGAMGTMLQAQDPSLDDFQGYEGCNEILNVTRPDIVAAVHAAYFDAGVDCVETNTFGANLANLGEYDIPERIRELASAGARIAREVADGYSTPDRPRWVLGLGRARAPSCPPWATPPSSTCVTPTPSRWRGFWRAASTRS